MIILKKTIRYLFVIVGLLLGVLLYLSFYHIESVEDIKFALKEELGKDVEIINVIDFEEDRIVNFVVEDNEGYIAMSKGLNNKYRLESGFFKPSNDQLLMFDYIYKREDYIVVLGNKNSDKITLNTVNGQVEVKITGDRVFEVINAGVKELAITSYIEDGQTIERNVDIAFMNNSGSIFNGPRHLVLISSILVFMGCWILSLLFTPKINRLERLYMKITGSYVKEADQVDEADGMLKW